MSDDSQLDLQFEEPTDFEPVPSSSILEGMVRQTLGIPYDKSRMYHVWDEKENGFILVKARTDKATELED